MKFVLSVCAYVIALQASAADLPTILDGRGIWMRHSRDLNSQLIDRMRLAGIKRVHVMGSKTFKQRTCSKAEPRIVDDADTIAKTVTVLKAAGFVSILTLYVPPTKTAVDSLMAEVIPKAIAAGVDGIEFDLEGDWSEHPACEYADHRSVFADLRVRTKKFRSGLPVGITTHSGRVNDPRVPMADADWLSLQLYSYCKKAIPPTAAVPAAPGKPGKPAKAGKPARCDAFSHPTTGPGGEQRQAINLLAGYEKPVIIGLAAYSQKWDGHTVDEAMQLALNATLTLIKNEPLKFVGYNYWANDSGLNPNLKKDEPFKFLVKTAKDDIVKIP